jgi:hypothetical protein
MVLTLNDLLKASMASLIDSGVPMIPPSSKKIITKDRGSSPLDFLMNRQGSPSLGN